MFNYRQLGGSDYTFRVCSVKDLCLTKRVEPDLGCEGVVHVPPIPSISDLIALLRALDEHPFASLTVVVLAALAIKGVKAWRRP